MEGKENCSRLEKEEKTKKPGTKRASEMEKEGKKRIELAGEERTEEGKQ